MVGLKLVSDTEKLRFLPKDVVAEVKKNHKWFSSHTTHHSKAFKHFTDNGKQHCKKYYIKTSDDKKYFSQEWIDFLISELSKDGIQDIIKSRK